MATKFDQHFLEDKHMLSKIIISSRLKKNETVLEIGPGNGVLTKKILEKAGNVIAVEIDEKFKKDLSKLDGLELHFGNILQIIDSLKFDKVVANIPYSISEPLFKKLFKIKLKKSVLLIGKNFYDLINSKESKLSLIINTFFKIKLIKPVPKECFNPKPRVDSVLISLTMNKSKDKFSKILREFILQDDKKVKNSLIKIFRDNLKMTKNESRAKIISLDINKNILELNVDRLSNKQFYYIVEKIKTIYDLWI